MTNLERRLRAHKRRQLRKNYIETMVKRQLMRVCAIVVVFAMICSITGMPAALAYFTSETKTSEPLSLVIVPLPKKTGANVLFTDGFIVEEKSGSGISTMAVPTRQSFSGGGMTLSVQSSAGQTEHNSASKILNEQETLTAVVILEDGFEAGEIYVPSLKIHYEGKSAAALSGELNEEGSLVAEFDRAEIASWFDGVTGGIEQVTFDVTGEGYEDGLRQYLFDGRATIKLTGSYAVNSVQIIGAGAHLIPAGGGTAAGTYQLTNQDGTLLDMAGGLLDKVDWSLETPAPGVEIDAAGGALAVSPDAAEGFVTITAVIESEGRTHQAVKTVALCRDPGLEIKGAGKITFPQGLGITTEAYSLTTQNGASLDSITWEIAEGADGITVDQDGKVTVDGMTTAQSFTLVARATLIDIPLLAETTVQLESMAPAGITMPEEPPVGSPGDQIIINGQSFIPLPAKGAVEVHTYSASDLAGGPLEGVAWSLQGEAEGVTLDGGTLTVGDTAAGGAVTLQAVLELPGEKEGEINVLTGRKLITIANPAPAAIEITGPGSIALPAADENNPLAEATHLFTAAVRDQLDNIMSGEAVTWELAEPVQGVSLSESGELTVTSLAMPGTISLIARSVTDNSIVGTLTVELGAGGAGTPGGGGGTPGNMEDAIKEEDDEEKGVVDDNGGSGGTGTGGDGDDVIRDDDDTGDQEDTEEDEKEEDEDEIEEDEIEEDEKEEDAAGGAGGVAEPGDTPTGNTEGDDGAGGDGNSDSGAGNNDGGIGDSLREEGNNGEGQTGEDTGGDDGQGDGSAGGDGSGGDAVSN
jgi:hypothetical protein